MKIIKVSDWQFHPDLVMGAFEEIPAIPIEGSNENSLSAPFSPIKFVDKLGKEAEEKAGEENFRVIDEEINIKGAPRKMSTLEVIDEAVSVIVEAGQASFTRKSDENIFNTPKRERHEDKSLNVRFTRFINADEEIEQGEGEDGKSLPRTPQKSRNEIVKSLSVEFEQRLASIHVSPKQPVVSKVAVGTPSPVTANNNNHSGTSRSMSPIRCAPQFSPAGRLNLDERREGEGEGEEAAVSAGKSEEFLVETPKLVSPSKIASVTTAVNFDIEKVKAEIDSKWMKQVEFLQFEISSLEEKNEISVKNNSEMRVMLAEYEKTLAQFIDARRTRPDQHSSIDQLLQDKKKLELEIQTLQISYQNLHQRYDDLKGIQEQSRINDATLRQSIQCLQQELATAVRTLDNTRRAYEDKLEKYAKSIRDDFQYF